MSPKVGFWPMFGTCLGLVVMLPAFSGTGHAQTQSDIIIGQGVAERACAGCHSINGSRGGTIEGKDVPTFRAIAGKGWSAERLQAYIATPHRPMPAVPLEMSDIRHVAAYILSLK
jgi:mono/diheme cytochrome c family protein